ncbi:MAG: formylglycine-generating enzyme family protein [Desertifilum sp. SIO1I2]|nr:formylglycine-generating enzyme family protein [Desertifilum sp. SIO1I2]
MSTILKSFSFEVVTVDRKGQETTRCKGEAEYFEEDLGDGVTLAMVYIPGGTFMMGAPEGEGGDSEKPQHQVTVPPFFLGQYPVTQAQWKQVAKLPKVQRDLKPDPASFKGADRPVECVSWYDAEEFIARLAHKAGKSYRLPSEAEWEYACRAGTTTPFHFGETITTDLANFDGNRAYGEGSKGTYREETTPVGYFKVANAFGLYDMHGNVWEWCLDDWHGNYQGAPEDGSAWVNKNDNDNQAHLVLRGGCWYHYPDECRSAYRDLIIILDRGNVYYDFGFRVACVADRTFSARNRVSG